MFQIEVRNEIERTKDFLNILDISEDSLKAYKSCLSLLVKQGLKLHRHKPVPCLYG